MVYPLFFITYHTSSNRIQKGDKTDKKLKACRKGVEQLGLFLLNIHNFVLYALTHTLHKKNYPTFLEMCLKDLVNLFYSILFFATTF